jgi:hypothetical protein
VEVAAKDISKRLQEIIEEGNVRRIIVRTQEGRVLLDTPVTVGAVATVLVAATGLLIPVALGGALLGMAAKLRVEIVREVREGDIIESKQRIEIQQEDEE